MIGDAPQLGVQCRSVIDAPKDASYPRVDASILEKAVSSVQDALRISKLQNSDCER